MAANKVKFGLKNVYYAVATEATSSGVTTTTYGTPVAFPGAVSLEVNASNSDPTIFRADDSDYFIVSGSTQGFDGTFESAYIPEAFEKNVLGMVADNDGVIVEADSQTVKAVALLFEINGDDHARRYLLPKVVFTKPGISAETTGTDGNNPKTASLSFKASPRPDDGFARIHTGDTTSTATYNAWFSAVYSPTFTQNEQTPDEEG